MKRLGRKCFAFERLITPTLKAAGSNPVGRTPKDDMFRHVVFFGLCAATRHSTPRVIWLGRSESALRQGFASQNACDAALAAKYDKASIPLGLHKPCLKILRQGLLFAEGSETLEKTVADL